MAKSEIFGVCKFFNNGRCWQPYEQLRTQIPIVDQLGPRAPGLEEAINSLTLPSLARLTPKAQRQSIILTGLDRWSCKAGRDHRGPLNADLVDAQRLCTEYVAGSRRAVRGG